MYNRNVFQCLTEICGAAAHSSQTQSKALTDSDFSLKTLVSTFKKIVQQFAKTESTTTKNKTKQNNRNRKPQSSTL